MNGVAALISDLELSLQQRDGDGRVETLRKVTDLFLVDAPALGEEQVEVFDEVITRLAAAIETRARAQLAERLADVANAPRGVVRSLAHDTIEVARPILARSPRLTDDDLVSVASSRGRDHMLAITERETLSEVVTDVLVERGDEVVAHAVAGNVGARFSGKGFDGLMAKAQADEALQALLQRRIDVPAAHMRSLVAIAKDLARKRMASALPASDARMFNAALDQGATTIEDEVRHLAGPRSAAVHDYRAAGLEIAEAEERGELNEFAVAEYARRHRFEEVVCAIASLARIALQTSERLFLGEDQDLLLIVARAQDWSWETAKCLLKLRGEEKATPHHLDKARGSFEQLNVSTAQRVLRFLSVREAAVRSPDNDLRARLNARI